MYNLMQSLIRGHQLEISLTVGPQIYVLPRIQPFVLPSQPPVDDETVNEDQQNISTD
jgi:hypothetical protein